MPKEIRPVTGFLVSVAENLVKIEDVSTEDRLKPLISSDDDEMVENTVSVMAAFCEKVREPRRRAKVAKRCLEMFRYDAKHKFAMRVITSDVMGRGRIHAVNSLHYKVSPFIVVDYLFARVNQLLMKLVIGIVNDNNGVIEAIVFVARNYKKPEVVVARLQQIECFQPHEFVVKADFWDKRNVRQFMDLVCRTLSISPPRQVRCVYLDMALEPCVSAVLNGFMEVEDFLPVCRNLVGQYDEIWNDVIGYVESRNGFLASIVATAAGKGKGKRKGSGKEKEKTIAQACSSPFNDVLHALPHEVNSILEK